MSHDERDANDGTTWDTTRRTFLYSGSALAVGLLGCDADVEGADDTTPTDTTGPGGGGAGGAGTGTGTDTGTTGPGGGGAGGGGTGTGTGTGTVTPTCEETEDDIEGPFYKPNAPEVTDGLPGYQTAGVVVLFRGSVSSAATCAPLVGATVDVWQADQDGAYDNVGFTLRGKVITDDEGNFAIYTVLPGHYLNGAQYRPAHIHVKVSAPGHELLTTQLYFPKDPYNDIDPWFDPALLVSVEPQAKDFDHVVFDFVIAAG